MKKESKNLKSGKFKKEELKLYEDLNDKDINIILEYQKLLPCLQEDSLTWISARVLHEQLKVKSKFADWIKNRINKYDFIEKDDYMLISKNLETSTGGTVVKEYNLTLDMAKQLCMIENNEVGILSRKYFIAIEKAFKSRYNWNKDRAMSILKYEDLRRVIFSDLYTNNKLGEYIPKWWRDKIWGKTNGMVNNTYAFELYLLNLIIIGKSAKQYRIDNKLTNSKLIRNTFSEEQLNDVHILESKDAEYLIVEELWNTKNRYNQLIKFYQLYKSGKITI